MALAVAIILPGAAHAQTADANLHIHAFGDWIYGKSNGNLYQSADKHGRYDDAALGLNLRYDVNENLAVVGQVAWEHAEGTAGDAETLLDYAFAQWTRNERLHVRMGRTYHPFGLYSEIRDLGTARPFIERPPEVYDPLGIVAESLNGVAIYGSLPSPSPKWTLRYDLYGGGTELPVIEAGEGGEENIERIKSVIGGKLGVETPVEGLRFSVSAFTGKRSDVDESHRSGALSLEYINDRWLVRAETAGHKEESESVRGSYIEAAFRAAGPWQLTVRYGTSRTSVEEHIDSRFLRHRDLAGGVNLWLDPKVVIKTELHFIEGNRLAIAAEGAEPRKSTRVFQAGVQFSF
jgi:hypothetical protein